MTIYKKERRRRGRPKSWDRTEVVRQVMEHYWRDGAHALSLNEVCRRVSVSKPSIYREFGGEDGLIEAVLIYYRNVVLCIAIEFLEQELPFSKGMKLLIMGLTTPNDYPPGCLFTNMRMIQTQLGPQSLEQMNAIEQERRTAIEQWYERALNQGEVIDSLSPAEASEYIDAQLTLLLLHIGMGRDPQVVRAQTLLAMSVLSP